MPEGLSREAAAIVPIGVDAARFPTGPRAEGPPWRLLRVASLNAVKDHRSLLRALSMLAERGLDVCLDIVGEDTMDGAIQALARELRLESCVTFHGVQPNDGVAHFYARAHLHVVSSRHEAAGVVVLEAAAAGLATVGTAVGYVADWHPDRAVAVPAGDPAALAGAISALLRDPARREALASAAREWTLTHDADWTADQFERIYSDVTAVSSSS
jgi:glycosyltransferase involved in cell wall biosynthesis